MVRLPCGEFILGNDEGESDEKPAHRVTVSAFYMDKYEVTQIQFQSLMGQNPSKYKEPDCPVEQLGWLAAVKYCNMRSLREGLNSCYTLEPLHCNYAANGYRLPTEAEWEYACKAGTQTQYSFGNDSAQLGKYAWYQDNSNKTTHPVGEKAPNPWGLYDLHGNVWEWCNTYYREDEYSHPAAQDPRGPKSGEECVLRGGGWNSSEDYCRSSVRFSESPGLADVCFGYDAYGFRCIRKVEE